MHPHLMNGSCLSIQPNLDNRPGSNRLGRAYRCVQQTYRQTDHGMYTRRRHLVSRNTHSSSDCAKTQYFL